MASMLALGLSIGPARAEKADRNKPMEVLADKSGTADLQNQVSRFSGNVLITQGTMVIKADRVEIRQTPDGYHVGTAWGAAGAPVSYRQKRDGVNEFVEGSAERVEFDGRAEVLRFIGNGVVRRLRGTEPVDEITGSLITWNHGSELFSVQGGTPSANNPNGRVRAVLGPRPAASAAEPR
jgi:lipopolysaccharide export system protein LptA